MTTLRTSGVDISSGPTIDDTNQTRSVTLTGVTVGDIIVVVAVGPLTDGMTFTLTGVSTSGTNEQIAHLTGGLGGGFGHATATTVTVSVACNGRRCMLLVAALAGITYTAGNAVGTNAVGPTDLDVGGTNGTSFAHPGAGGVEVVAWGLFNGDLSTGDPAATSSFTDTNGSYSTVAGVMAGTSFATQSRSVAEIAFADVPASGTTNHVGHRTDNLSGTGFMLSFVAPPPPPPPREPLILCQAVRRAARG